MSRQSQRFAIALLLFNLQPGYAARKQVERASFQPLFENHDTPEVGDVLDTQASAKKLPRAVENHKVPEVSVVPVVAQISAQEVPPALERHDVPKVGDVPEIAKVGAQELPLAASGRDVPKAGDVRVITQDAAKEIPRAADGHDAPEGGEVPRIAQDAVQELPLAADGSSTPSEHLTLHISTWLTLVSALAQGTVADANPGESLSVIFALSCVAYSFWVFLRYGHDGTISLRLKVIENQRHQFQKAYDAFTGSTVQTLNALSESVALIAERSFEGKRRHFLKLVRRIRDHPERVGSSSECTPAFRQLVSEWLAVFQECDLGQATSSEEVEELAEGSTVDRVAVIACERLESTSAAEIARELESFMGPLTQQGVKALEDTMKSGAFPLTVTIGCGGRFCFTLLSVSHTVGLSVVLLGLVLAGVEAVERQLWLATAVFCADACLFGVLLRYDKIDKMCRIEGEVRRLRLQSRAARRRHGQVAAFHKKVQAVTHLWVHRTMPQLEIFGGLFDLLWGPLAGSADVALFPDLARKLARMRGGLGPLSAWCGEEALHVDELQEIAGTLCDCADFIKGQQDDAKPECLLEILRHLDQMELPNAAQEEQTASGAS